MSLTDIARILCVRADGIGDLLNSTPALGWLRQSYPEAHLTCLVSSLAAPLLEANPTIDEIWTLPERNPLDRWWRCLVRVRKASFDLAIALQTSAYCHWLVGASGARYRVGRDEKRFRKWLTHPCRRRYAKGEVPEVERNLDLVRPFCTGSPPTELQLVLRSTEIEDARKRLKPLEPPEPAGWEGAPLVLIHPGGSSEDKRWPAPSFAAIAHRLQERGYRVILIHGPGEATLARTIQRLCPLPAVEPDSLRSLAGLLRLAHLFICNDSGPMHIAAALNVPTVAIFGPTDHVRWGPRNVRIVRREMPCWPCSAHRCTIGHDCIKGLAIEPVWRAVEELCVGVDPT